MLRTPPHILVTTPESLYLLLTSERSRADAAHGAHGHRRRDPRRDRHAARRAPRAVARAAAAASPSSRCCASASRRRRSRSRRSRGFLVGTDAREPLRDRRRRSPPRRWTSASRSRGSPLDAVMSHEVWEEYYDRLAELDQRASDDARLRQHAADGGAARAAPERAARRGRGHRASRQPVEGDAARRRDAAEGRRSCGRSSRRRRSSSASTSATSISSARSARRTASRRCCSASAAPATRIGGTAEGPAVPDVARRPDRVRGAAARGPPRRARRHRRARRAARRPGAADRRRDARAASTRRRAVRARPRARGRTASCRARTSTPCSRWPPKGSPRGAAAARRSSTATRSTALCAAGAARGCSR